MKFSKLKTIGKLFLKIIMGFFLFSLLVVFLFKWVDPKITAFMIQDKLEAIRKKEKTTLRREWADLKNISPSMQVAVIAAEDQNFSDHHGFDFEAIEKAIKHNQRSRRLRGASTISQQVAKNLFLWPGRSFMRKGLEAYFTTVIELLWSKKRILEVYLNTVELGKHTFGVEAASKLYFNTSAKRLTPEQAALLAAILPNPHRFSARNPSRYIMSRKYWVLRQMQFLGESDYLKGLCKNPQTSVDN
jgi:monofunctional biosynthetic peptidoglycan transglycosylase